jgi:hypothetical protein
MNEAPAAVLLLGAVDQFGPFTIQSQTKLRTLFALWLDGGPDSTWGTRPGPGLKWMEGRVRCKDGNGYSMQVQIHTQILLIVMIMGVED